MWRLQGWRAGGRASERQRAGGLFGALYEVYTGCIFVYRNSVACTSTTRVSLVFLFKSWVPASGYRTPGTVPGQPATLSTASRFPMTLSKPYVYVDSMFAPPRRCRRSPHVFRFRSSCCHCAQPKASTAAQLSQTFPCELLDYVPPASPYPEAIVAVFKWGS